MILTKKQEQALKICIERYKNNEKYTCISGYAGTGKSTLVKFLVKVLNIDEEYVCYATYTGKAAQVLLSKGNKNVNTLHKLLYFSHQNPDGTFVRVPKSDIKPYKLIIIDETSMIPNFLIELLFKHQVHIICLGDPFQLPPPFENEDNHLLDNPHIFLDEIMRQEADSEIIQLTMKIRNLEPIPFYEGKDVKVLDKRELNTGMLLWADQILVGTNKTRININNEMRRLLNKNEEKPMEGDKVICLRNYWDIFSTTGDNLINGTIGYLKNKFDTCHYLPSWVTRFTNTKCLDVTCADLVINENDEFINLDMDTHMILTGEKCIDSRTAYRLSKNDRTADLVPLEFTYGYAITTHKAQGSQFDKVLILEEKFPFDSEEHSRWLYTSCTRASSKLVLLR